MTALVVLMRPAEGNDYLQKLHRKALARGIQQDPEGFSTFSGILENPDVFLTTLDMTSKLASVP